MPQIGEVRRAREIGKGGNQSVKYIWQACVECGKERWVDLGRLNEPNYTGFCHICNKVGTAGLGGWGESGIRGKFKTARGCWVIKLYPEDFFYPSTNKKGEILEHRLVMAKHLGRNLHRWELVHHKGTKYPPGSIENKRDNRIENLQLVSEDRHTQITLLERRIKYLEKLLSKNEIPF